MDAGGELLSVFEECAIICLLQLMTQTEATYQNALTAHYCNMWGDFYKPQEWQQGPISEVAPYFKVLEFAPEPERDMWVYATLGFSEAADMDAIELHIFSGRQDAKIIELLTVLAYYHRTSAKLQLNDTINFGMPWQPDSLCTYGLISLPYVYGPELENATVSGREVKCYWLIPITEGEQEYKAAYGIEALEEKFEEEDFNFLDSGRGGVV